ncbi:MAG: hypothetical protein Kilf2KO_26820 [Rhodospirillales bacterium]
MKRYLGDRTVVGPEVTVDGHPLPDGREHEVFTKNEFEWSYEGPEPRQLAFALLLDHLGDAGRAKALTQAFMAEIVANFGNDWELTSDDMAEIVGELET